MCWLDADRICLGGIGDDDDWMIDGTRIFTAAESDASGRLARELDAFAGPRGDFFSDGRRLFSAADDALAVWDVEARRARRAHRRLHTEPPARPRPRAGADLGQRLLRWRY
jgi:hypothetical protein